MPAASSFLSITVGAEVAKGGRTDSLNFAQENREIAGTQLLDYPNVAADVELLASVFGWSEITFVLIVTTAGGPGVVKLATIADADHQVYPVDGIFAHQVPPGLGYAALTIGAGAGGNSAMRILLGGNP